MKAFQIGLMVLLFAGIVCGQPLEITAYDPVSGEVKIKDGSGSATRLFDTFSAEEQQQITEWLADKEFRKLKITIQKESKKEYKEESFFTSGSIKKVSYSITVKNPAQIEFKDLELVCRIFCETKGGKVDRPWGVEDKKKFTIAPGETQRFEQSVGIRDQKTEFESYRDSSWNSAVVSPEDIIIKDKLLGLYLCISKKGRNGKVMKLEQEAGYPR